jgi:hypothetical protein
MFGLDFIFLLIGFSKFSTVFMSFENTLTVSNKILSNVSNYSVPKDCESKELLREHVLICQDSTIWIVGKSR